jgi:hypothetical protein
MMLDQETLVWYSADAPPDDTETVMVYTPSACEPVWLGYCEGGTWFDIAGFELVHDVTAWAVMPVGAVCAEDSTSAKACDGR